MRYQRLASLLSICLATTPRSVAGVTAASKSGVVGRVHGADSDDKASPTIVAVTTAQNDLVNVLQACGMDVLVRLSAADGLEAARKDDLLMLLADG